LAIEGGDAKRHSVVRAVHNASTSLQETQGASQRCDLPDDVVEQDHLETIPPDDVAINNQIRPLPIENREEKSHEPTTSVPPVSPAKIATTIITDTAQRDAPAENQIVGEAGSAHCGRDTTSSDSVATASPCENSAEPLREIDVSPVNAADVKPTNESIPSGDELLSEDDVDHTWVADDDETTTTIVLPDPPSTDPTLRSETIAPAELDTKPSHSEATPDTLYVTLLSPGEIHEQRVSYLVGDLPKVAVMVPHPGPQTTDQEVVIQEEKEAEQAAEKIEAERIELERSAAYEETVTETKTASVACEDESILPVESVIKGQWWVLTFRCQSELKFSIGIGIPQLTETLDETPNLAEQEQGNLFHVTADKC
jgi:hypothetical protein